MMKELLDKITSIPPLPECGIVLEKYSRLKCLLTLLDTTDLPSDSESTLQLINSTIVQVEDCYSGVEAAVSPGLRYNGRMYPIENDNIDRKEGGAIVAITRGNKILIEPSGSFSILTRLDEDELLIKKHGS